MWQRMEREAGRDAPGGMSVQAVPASTRRAYYRVSAWVPVRVSPLPPDRIDAAIYDLSLPDPLPAVSASGEGDEPPWLAPLRRIEEKLDRLLGTVATEVERPLTGGDRRWIVFSGSGLALDVDFDFQRGDAFRVELLLPKPSPRVVRAVAEAVADSGPGAQSVGPRRLALRFVQVEAAARDALVAFSYDIQRLELRAKVGGVAVRS